MARKKIDTRLATPISDRSKNLSALTPLVKEWGKNKTEYDKLKKVVDRDAKEIKALMTKEGLEECVEDGYIAKLSMKHTESFDEDGVLEYIKSVLWGDKGSMECPYIQRVEIIDWDALEKAIYNKELTQDEIIGLEKYKEVKDTPVLNIGYVKED